MPRAFALLLALTFILETSTLHADEPRQTGTPAPGATAAPTPSDHELPYVSVRYNPLGLLIGRKSGDIEVWPSDHVSLIATPWMADYSQAAQTGDKGGNTSANLHLSGLEAGIRVWPIRPHVSHVTVAPFVGLNGGWAWGRLDSSSDGASYGNNSSSYNVDSIQQLIVAGEAGVALVARPFILEVGLGIQWTQSMGTDPKGPTFWDCSWVCVDNMHFYYGNGLLPRVLVSGGFAF